ncbi:hypothetical protein [uncultured Aquimarina sp.]|uniref:hypothetical protein n=1 Tax=uncultured Aquimarina sp. TaxID=575652 RepID=UPI002617120C|nr:hypothetical protein [uncultured Aquimarina sp.]
MKKENRNFSLFIILGLAAIPMFFNESEYFKSFKSFVDEYSVYYPTLIIIFMVWSILSNLQYDEEKSIKITTENDSYNNILPYIFGSIAIVTSLVLIYYSVFDYKILIQVLVIGFLLILSGIFYKPMSYVKVKKEKLIFVINDTKQWIRLDKIKSINIQYDKILVLEKSNQINNIDFLNLDLSDLERLKKYLNTNTNAETEIESV